MFTVVALASIALGIGANTTIFPFVDRVLLRLLPVRSPEPLIPRQLFVPYLETKTVGRGAGLCHNTARQVGRTRQGQAAMRSRLEVTAASTRSLLTVMAVLTALMLPASSLAGVNITKGKWRDGRIVWYYNGDQIPVGLNDTDFLALTRQAFGIWSAGCEVTAQYGGTTTVAADNAQVIAANKVVVGFVHLPANVGGSASPFSTDSQSNFYYFTSGVVQIGADSTPYNLDPARLLYTLVHEIGHLLNVGHSDEPSSVMYANPYSAISSALQPYHLYADDIATCANLYGSKGVQPTTDYRTVPFTPDSRYRLSAGVGSIDSNGAGPIAIGSPEDTWRSVNPGAVDLSQMGNFPWMRVLWNNPLEERAAVRIIAPTGDVVLDNWSVGTGPRSTIPLGYQPFRWGMWLNGRWTMQVFVNGHPAAETQFTTVNGLSSPAKLEVAAIAESGTSGRMTFRIANYSAVGIVSSSAYLNGDYRTSVQTFTRAAGNNVIELWAQSDLPRYRAGASCGQPGASSDLTRQVVLVADATGSIVNDAISVSETGTLIAYSAKGSIQATEAGPVNVYVAAQVHNDLYFRQPDGTWSTSQAPLFSLVAPGAANFDILRDVDTRDLPSGTTFYVGYGATLNQMIASRQYKAVRVF